jgi:hypothetical protein
MEKSSIALLNVFEEEEEVAQLVQASHTLLV